jgi:SAM-dependent methyltransferase
MHRLQSALDGLLSGRRDLKVLEAGCGSITRIDLPERAHIVGIDISSEQLARNPKLRERILGDIQEYRLPAGEFDLIICWDVLEHVQYPERALGNFARALSDGGLLLLAMPNADSVKGMVTKYTPLWFHRWFYRNIYGLEHVSPFRTHMDRGMSPRAVLAFARRSGLTVEYLAFEEAGFQTNLRRRFRLVGSPWSLIKSVITACTLGRVSPEHTEVRLILKKCRSRP